MRSTVAGMDIVLIAGLWLPASVWDATATHLERRGHRVTALELPGVDDGSRDASLDDQAAIVFAAVDAADGPVVVGHSAAASLAWLAADRRPDAVSGVVMIGGFPAATGSSYAAFFEIVDDVMAFPGWGPFEGADTADLDESARRRLAAQAVPVPGPVADGRVVYGDDRRFSVPVTVVCPEFTPDDFRGWLAAGDIPELDRVERLDLVDIDSGHWPMVTRAGELADLIHAAATLDDGASS